MKILSLLMSVFLFFSLKPVDLYICYQKSETLLEIFC